MYLEFYGLIEKPFSLTPDPKYFFASGCHAEARDLLRYGVREREGFMCFVGAAGTGKTTLLRTVLEGFGSDVVTALVLNPYLSEDDLLRLILLDFGVATREDFDADRGRRIGKQELISRLNRHLMSLSMQGRAAVLVIDEAQNLPLPVMEQIRLLSNLETAKSKLLQIVLAGQLGLRRLLATPELSQLAQRVSVRYTLQPFNAEEIRRYIDHRLRIAGSDGDIVFDEGALRRVHRYSEGVPRLVNLICDRALLAGYAQRTTRISGGIVDRAAETLDLAQPGTVPPMERPVLEAATRTAPTARTTGAGTHRFRPTVSHLVGGLAMATAMIAGVLMMAPWLTPRPGLKLTATPRAEGAESLAGTSGAAANREAPSAGARMPAEVVRPSGSFTVYLSSFRRPDDAQLVALRQRLQSAGQRTFLIGANVPGQGRLHRLIVGDFTNQRAALAVADRLRQELGMAHAEVVAVADVVGR